MRTILVTAFAAVIMLTVTQPVTAQSGQDLFQQALVKERADGDLRGAIEIYERIASEFNADRTLAANALVQMGQCYEKLGSKEAERAYQRVVQDYADQAEVVTRARARLAALRRPPARAEESAILLRQLPADPGFIDGSAMPDARSFVYIDYSTGDVALQDLVSGETRHLTDEGTWESPAQYAINAVASPDGKLVAYTWSTQNDSLIELRVVALDGSAPRVLCSNTDEVGYPMSWSSDGRHIAVWVFDSAERTGSVAWVSVEDSSMRRLATFPSWEWASLSHSPDDRFVVVEYPVKQDSGRYDLFAVATGGGETVPLVDHPANDRLLGWLPSTEYVLFLSDRSGDWDLWAIQVKDGRVSGDPVALKRGVGNIDALGFTEDGSMAFYVYTIRLAAATAPFDVATGQMELAASEPLLGSLSRGVWSPSGRYLAFVRQETGPGGPGRLESVLVVKDLATGGERRLAGNLHPLSPRWFPDEESILLAAMEKERPGRVGWGLYLVDVATGDARAIVDPGADPQASIGGIPTADGEGLIYARDGRLALRDLSSGRETELHVERGLATNPFALSPNGAEVVFAVNEAEEESPVLAGDGKLMVAPLAGGEVQELIGVEGPGSVYCIQWTPDGRHVLYLQVQPHGEEGAALWRVSRTGGEAEKLWQTEDRIVWFGLSPDAKQAVYVTSEVDFEVWMMDNLREVLERGR